MRAFTGFLYRVLVKPVLFRFPADRVHEWFLKKGKLLGRYRFSRAIVGCLWRYQHPMLSQNVFGRSVVTPIGLAAGFDYNADLVNILPEIGFGFHTVGTLTYGAYDGNPPPMLARLPKSKALLVNKGFKNRSITTVLPTLGARTSGALRGVSIGATNKPYGSFEVMVEDIVKGFALADDYDTFDYFELNISCPNLHNIQNLPTQIASPEGFRMVLDALALLGIERPVCVKLPLERTHEAFRALVDVAVPYTFIKGLIISNLAKDRTNKAFDACEVAQAGVGNFSGKPTEQGANDLIAYARKTYNNRFVIVGVGGVFNAQDAYTKIQAGADLVQLITGMVYRGPQLVGEINEGLVRLLKKNGYTNVAEAVGVALVE